MRRLLLAITGILLAIVVALGLALRSESTVLSAVQWAVGAFTDLRLELRNPRVDFYQGRIFADEIHLVPGSGEAPALLSVLDFSANFPMPGVAAESSPGSFLQAGAVMIYVSDSDNAADPEPMQWLGYLRWLPSELYIGQVHLITASVNTWIFPLKQLRGERLGNSNYRLTAEADYEGEPLGVTVDLLEVDKGRGVTAAETRIELSAPDSGSEFTLSGTLEGTKDDFHYNFVLDAFYRDIHEFLKGFEGGNKLAGTLRLHGTMAGDTRGFILSDATFLLDNMPNYEFEAGGSLEYQFSGETNIALTATGELASLSYIVDWVDLDVGDFGRVQSSLRLSGSLNKPVIDTFRLATSNEAGLAISMSGQLKLYEEEADNGLHTNTLFIDMQGPSLAVLEHWLGKLPYDTGHWRASGQLTGDRKNLSLQNIVLETGTPGSLEIRATGALGRISTPQGSQENISVSDILLSLQAHVPDVEGDLNIETRGRIGNLATFSDVSLTSNIDDTDTRTLLATLLPDFNYAAPLGSLKGSFNLAEKQGVWTVSKLALAGGDDTTPLEFTLGGEIDDLTGLIIANLDSQFRLGDPVLLEALSGLALKSLSGSLVLATTPGEIYGALKAQVGDTHVNGDARIALKGKRIQDVQLTLDTPHIYLQDFGFEPPEEAAIQGNAAPDSATRISVQKVATEAPGRAARLLAQLRQKAPPFPVDVTLKIGGISGDNSNIDSLEVRVTGTDNRYTLERLSASYNQTLAEVRGIIDLNPDPPAMSLAGQAYALPLSALLKDVGVTSSVSGALTILGGITVMGDTPDALMHSLDGSVAIALENAVIEGAAYDLLATDLLAWVYSGALTEKSTYIDCTMARFQLRQGVASTKSLYIESAKMIATGEAEFDLVKRRMDLRITPLSKSRLLQLPSEVRLKGDMGSPKADISPISAVADATSAVVMLIPSLTLKLFGISQSSDKIYRPCQASLGN